MTTFDERRAGRPGAPTEGLKVFTAAEFAALPRRVTSEERLERLRPDLRAVERFREKANELKREANLQTQLITDAHQLPVLASDTRHKYPYCFDECRQRLPDGEDLLIAVAIEDLRVIGFGIAARGENGVAKIEIVDVDESSRRSSGLHTSLELQGEIFTIGVAHILVDLMSAELDCAIQVDATTSGSRYVFKSLGFTREPGNANPCRLWRPPTSA